MVDMLSNEWRRTTMTYTFKVATERWELDQIHELNYKTFVEEIPQHAPNISKILIDKFHHENTYLICLCGDRLIGMAAVRSARPFSLDSKLTNLDSYLPAARSLCEIRLLAVERNHRKGRVFCGVLTLLVDHLRQRGHDLTVISGTSRQQKLYANLGFVPFGPLVGTAEAQYQPMYISFQRLNARLGRLMRGAPLGNHVEMPANPCAA
jgi:hypothetical protein